MLWRVKLISICRPLLGCLFHLAPSPDMTKCFSLFYFFVNSQDDQHLYTVWILLPPSLAHHPRQSCAWVIHCGTHTHTPEPLTQPVFSGDLAKSLTIRFPSSEEVDWAVLPALNHLHSQDSKTRVQGSDEIHHTRCASSSIVMTHSEPLCWSLSSSRTKLNELINACSFTNE